jgi:hypothetical protein
VVNVLGGSKLDLSEAELAADRVDLKIISVLGGAEITLPTGLNVVLVHPDDFATMRTMQPLDSTTCRPHLAVHQRANLARRSVVCRALSRRRTMSPTGGRCTIEIVRDAVRWSCLTFTA